MKQWILEYMPNDDTSFEQRLIIIADICYKISDDTVYCDRVVIKVYGNISELKISDE